MVDSCAGPFRKPDSCRGDGAGFVHTRPSLVGSGVNSPGELESLLGKEPHYGHGRSGPPERFKQQSHRLLHLLVRVHHHLPIRVINESHRWANEKFSTSSLVADAALQSSPQHMQFCFTHRALQASDRQHRILHFADVR